MNQKKPDLPISSRSSVMFILKISLFGGSGVYKGRPLYVPHLKKRPTSPQLKQRLARSCLSPVSRLCVPPCCRSPAPYPAQCAAMRKSSLAAPTGWKELSSLMCALASHPLLWPVLRGPLPHPAALWQSCAPADWGQRGLGVSGATQTTCGSCPSRASPNPPMWQTAERSRCRQRLVPRFSIVFVICV